MPMMNGNKLAVCVGGPTRNIPVFAALHNLPLFSPKFKGYKLNLISRIDILSISCETDLRWMPQDPTDD